MHPFGLNILGVGAVIADVWVGKGNDLLAIAGIGQDLLVAGHGRIEHDLADRGAWRSNGIADIDRAVCEGQNGRGGSSLERQKHWVLRLVYGCAQASSRTVLGG